jgi:superfamily II DNA or RNA helicase/HKD family nuclease
VTEDGLPFGPRDELITEAVAAGLAALHDASGTAEQRALDADEAATYLAHHLRVVLRRHLDAVPRAERTDAQVDIANRLIAAAVANGWGGVAPGDAIAEPAAVLTGVDPPLPPGAVRPAAPTLPLGQHDLLTGGRDEPSLMATLVSELPSADRVDAIVAFVKWSGLRLLLEPLEDLLRREMPIRLLTTTYIGVTERKALDWLAERGAEIRVSYDDRTTRLHAKSWIVHRDTGWSTAFVGSSNLSAPALLDGMEWNVRVSATAAPELFAKLDATFERTWASAAFQPYDPSIHGELVEASRTRRDDVVDLVGLEVRPWPYQEAILERLEVERLRHGRTRTLVVAPTGTGKTIVAALDYRRLVEEHRDLSLLFVAHRKEILTQSRHVFRQVLEDGAFGELYVGGERPTRWRHVFASIQSLHAGDITETLAADHFDVVIVDEFHHAEADTYTRLLDHLQPRYLLGLTATPERADGKDVTRWFDDRIASEMRLWDALDQQLLAPLQYFGVADDVDLSAVEWRRGGYATEQLSTLYTGDDARTAKVLRALRDVVGDVDRMRAFGFCVSVDHARYMARRFTEAGVASAAITGDTPAEERSATLQQLARGELRVVFGVDVLTEGVDVPEVDTILLLRPTESVTVFLQQIGRGLRRRATKACCTVLDFIGQQRREFRFDLRMRALTGTSRGALQRQIEQGFPFLPTGCHIDLDRQATGIVLENVRQALRVRKPELVDELKRLTRDEGEPSLLRFLDETGIELHDLARPSIGGWAGLRRLAGLEAAPPGPDEDRLARAIWRWLHPSDPMRLGWMRELAAVDHRAPIDGAQMEHLAAMAHVSLWPAAGGPSGTLAEGLDRLDAHPARCRELGELADVLDERADHVTHPLRSMPGCNELHDVPLHVHAAYSRDEILAAFGILQPGERPNVREGVKYDEATNTDLFFVTVHKTEDHYSPTTMYRDYPISRELFHWESQSNTSQDSPVGRRYVDGASRILLFVRERRRTATGDAAPYLFLGPATFVEARGSRPISITWRLAVPTPQTFFDAASALVA